MVNTAKVDNWNSLVLLDKEMIIKLHEQQRRGVHCTSLAFNGMLGFNSFEVVPPYPVQFRKRCLNKIILAGEGFNIKL